MQRVTEWERCIESGSHTCKAPENVQERTSIQVTRVHLPRGSHDSFTCIRGAPEARTAKGVTKGGQGTLKIQLGSIHEGAGSIHICARNQQVNLDRSRGDEDRSKSSQVSTALSGSIQKCYGSIHSSKTSAINIWIDPGLKWIDPLLQNPRLQLLDRYKEMLDRSSLGPNINRLIRIDPSTWWIDPGPSDQPF